MNEEENISVVLDANRTLFLSEISRHAYDDQGIDGVGGDGGLFVVLEDCTEEKITVLAKAANVQTGRQLMELIAEARRQQRAHLTVVR